VHNKHLKQCYILLSKLVAANSTAVHVIEITWTAENGHKSTTITGLQSSNDRPWTPIYWHRIGRLVVVVVGGANRPRSALHDEWYICAHSNACCCGRLAQPNVPVLTLLLPKLSAMPRICL